MFENFIVENLVPKDLIVEINESAIYCALMNLIRFVAENDQDSNRFLRIAFDDSHANSTLVVHTGAEFNALALSADRGLVYARDRLRSAGGNLAVSSVKPRNIEIQLPKTNHHHQA